MIQAYANYSVQDQETWAILYERQVKAVQVTLDGLQQLKGAVAELEQIFKPSLSPC